MGRKILENYYYPVRVGSPCALCEECVAVCPGGALMADERLTFNTSNCDGCGLCEEFCPLPA